MDDDDLANVLRSSGNTGLPSFYSPTNNSGSAVEDPFANPFANPFASGTSQRADIGGAGQASASANDFSREDSPYVAQLQREGVIGTSADGGATAGGFAPGPYTSSSTLVAHTSAYTSFALNDSTDGGFSDADTSGGFGSASISALPDPYTAADPFAPSPFAPSPFQSSPLRSPHNHMTQSLYSPGISRSPQVQSSFRSSARTKPTSDILGLLDDADGTTDLKKAFVASSSRKGSNQGDSPSASSPEKPRTGSAPYVFKPGGAGSRRKPVGISVDSVRQEREKERLAKEQEAQAKAMKEREELEKAKVEQEKDDGEAVQNNTDVDVKGATAKQLHPIENDSAKGPDGNSETLDQRPGQFGTDPSHDDAGAEERPVNVDAATAPSTAEGEVTDVITVAPRAGTAPVKPLSPASSSLDGPLLPAAPASSAEESDGPETPIIPSTVAAQILSAEHPDVASRNVAEVLAESSGSDSALHPASTSLPVQQADPASVPLPGSRMDSPEPQTSTASRIASPLDDRGEAIGSSFANLALGGASFSGDDDARATASANSGTYPSWGRAFNDSQSNYSDTNLLPNETSTDPKWASSAAPIASPLDAGFGGSSNAWNPSEHQYDAAQQYSDMTGVSMTDDPAPISPISSAARSPTRNRILSQPLFTINISDPTKVGDPVRGYIVYTVTTRTTSPHFKRGEFSVLRRFSDFLWLCEAVSNNNPGVIVPPMPDKHAFGRFEEQFVETRRAALERTLGKMANHPVLSLDPDLKLFLSSDTFSIDVKNRRQELVQEKQGMLASIGGTIGGPRFTEQDEWFDKQKSALDALETQIKALTKCLEVSSKHRLELALSVTGLADALRALSECDLSYDLAQLLETFSDLSAKERELEEEQAKMDVVRLLNLADEHSRLIGSVRAAFTSRVKSYFNWQNAESEARRLKVQYERDRAKKGGKYAPDKVGAALPDVAQAERRALDAHSDFDAVSRLVKLEFARFEQERVEDYKQALELYVEEAVDGQRRLIGEWEGYYKSLTTIVTQNRETRSKT